jgi:hypothetical protein
VEVSPSHQVALRGQSLGTGLGEPGGDHHDAAHLLRPALLDDLGHLGSRHRDHRQVDLVRDVDHARVGLHVGDALGRGVHGVDRSREPAFQ